MNSRSILVADELDNVTEVGKTRSAVLRRFASDLSDYLGCTTDLIFVRRMSDIIVKKGLTAEQKSHILDNDFKNYQKYLKDFKRPGKLFLKLGWPIEEISKLIKSEKHFESIVLGTRSLKGIERFFLGSVAEEVIRHVDRPVFILGPEVIQHEYRFDSTQKKTFVVATDLSKRCRAAETYAVSMAQKTGAKVIFYYNLADTLETAEKFGYGAGEMLPSLDTVLADIKREVYSTMEKKISRLRKKGLDCEPYMELKNSNVGDSLKKFSADKTFVFMGHQTHGYIASTILGSNVRSLVMESKVPVVVIRS